MRMNYSIYKKFSLWMSVLRYVVKFRKPLYLNNPKDLNEKVFWLAFNAETEQWADLADKIKVHEYLDGCGLSNLSVPILKVWKSADEINFDELPKSFVIKTNHGCGDVFVIKDKSKANLDELRKKMDKYLKRHFGLWTGEPHYLKIKPYIFAEQTLKNDCEVSSSLVDYKFYCFNGKPECILVCYDRKGLVAQKVCYDMQWNRHEEWTHFTEKSVVKDIPKPKTLAAMVDACMKLGKQFPFVRIDFYESEGKCYFGEMTFTPAAGRSTALTPEYLKILGDKLNLK